MVWKSDSRLEHWVRANSGCEASSARLHARAELQIAVAGEAVAWVRAIHIVFARIAHAAEGVAVSILIGAVILNGTLGAEGAVVAG